MCHKTIRAHELGRGEQWVRIADPRYSSEYAVSTRLRVRRLNTGRILKTQQRGRVILRGPDGIKQKLSIRRLAYEAFNTPLLCSRVIKGVEDNVTSRAASGAFGCFTISLSMS
jgi:hypothetical protein